MVKRKKILVYSTPDCSDNMHANGEFAAQIINKYTDYAFAFRDAAAVTQQELCSANVVAGHPNPQWLKGAKELEWLHVQTAGVEAYADASLYANKNVIVTRTAHAFDTPVAEHVVAMLLSLLRLIPQNVRQGAACFLKREHPIRELTGARVLVLGAGALGTAVARCLRGFSTSIWGVCRHPEKLRDGFEKMLAPGELSQGLSWADVVINVLPLTKETERLVDDAAFSRMKEGAVFINAGRGRSVDTDALVKALRSGKLSAAGLDVTEPEPLPPDHVLWRMENVLITPHTAGFSLCASQRQFRCFVELLDIYLQGGEMPDQVDLRAGY